MKWRIELKTTNEALCMQRGGAIPSSRPVFTLIIGGISPPSPPPLLPPLPLTSCRRKRKWSLKCGSCIYKCKRMTEEVLLPVSPPFLWESWSQNKKIFGACQWRNKGDGCIRRCQRSVLQIRQLLNTSQSSCLMSYCTTKWPISKIMHGDFNILGFFF